MSPAYSRNRVRHAEAEDRQELTQYWVLYTGPDQLREVAAAMGGRRSGLPFFADAVLCDDDLSKRFLRLHVAFEGASAQLGRDIALLSMLGALVRRQARTPGVRESLTGPREAVQVARAYLKTTTRQRCPCSSWNRWRR